jgi:hypothetical protein
LLADLKFGARFDDLVIRVVSGKQCGYRRD